MNWTIIICVLIIAGVVLALSGRRINPGNFFRAIVSPAWNSKIFLGLAAAVIILLFVAIYQGGGKPLGLTALQSVANEPTPKTEAERYYTDSARYFVTGSEKPTAKPAEPAKSEPTWNWWLILFAVLITFIVFIPLAFWDEIRDAWHWAMERAEQRRAVIDLRPPAEPAVEQTLPPTPGQAPGPVARPASSSMWQKFKDHFPAVLSANTLIEFVEGLIKKIVTDRLMRRVR